MSVCPSVCVCLSVSVSVVIICSSSSPTYKITRERCRYVRSAYSLSSTLYLPLRALTLSLTPPPPIPLSAAHRHSRPYEPRRHYLLLPGNITATLHTVRILSRNLFDTIFSTFFSHHAGSNPAFSCSFLFLFFFRYNEIDVE